MRLDQYDTTAPAYFNSHEGLLPCKVRHVHPDGSLTIQITARRNTTRVRIPYKYGETIRATQAEVVPRSRVFRLGGRPMIKDGYQWV